tara:strand:- start:25750 stop:25971 length:222 start_codon:yes stop_codon:yes gene_type:complete
MLYETAINNVKLDVYYDCLKTTDGYSTGDSPTQYEIDFNSIETASDSQNLMSILSEDILMILETEIIAYEASK